MSLASLDWGRVSGARRRGLGLKIDVPLLVVVLMISAIGFVVLYSAFVIGPQHWPISLFLAVSTVNYAYKMLAAIVLIPLIYVAKGAIIRYLGEARADELRKAAAAA